MSYAHDIFTGLNYIHSQGIIHADIKLDNVLTCASELEGEYPLLKLCDFGLSQKMGSNGKVAI